MRTYLQIYRKTSEGRQGDLEGTLCAVKGVSSLTQNVLIFLSCEFIYVFYLCNEQVKFKKLGE